ncbi:MAG: hypothetical protein ACFFD1_12090 [Candidatus Thorarchaeota archaeon]
MGIPTLCSNIDHSYHESKFEAKTCNLLLEYFPANEILIPPQHNFSTRFDFYIPETAIIEPHAIWNNLPGNTSYFDYYKTRKQLAEQNKKTQNLPILVLSCSSDLSLFKHNLKEISDNKKAINQTILELLKKYEIDTKEIKEEDEYPLLFKYYKILMILGITGWLIAGITFILFILK